MKDIKCPYCGKKLDVDYDDDFGYEEGVKNQKQCSNCKKIFLVEASTMIFYEVFRADCLNGAHHDYKLTTSYPKEFSEMVCTTCYDRRELTDAERIDFNIGTKENYFYSLTK